MDSQAKICITRMPHKKYEQAVFAVYLNDELIGSLKPSEFITVFAAQGLIKLKAVIGSKSYSKIFSIKQDRSYYYNIEIREPKWHIYLKYGLSALGLVLILLGLYYQNESDRKYENFVFAALLFISFLDKREEPMWEQVSI